VSVVTGPLRALEAAAGSAAGTIAGIVASADLAEAGADDDGAAGEGLTVECGTAGSRETLEVAAPMTMAAPSTASTATNMVRVLIARADRVTRAMYVADAFFFARIGFLARIRIAVLRRGLPRIQRREEQGKCPRPGRGR
jgi:hypothetical protein